MAAASFYFGIFKKIQVCAGVATGYPHSDPSSTESLGFNLATSDANGIFAPLDRAAINLPANAFGPLKPLVNHPDPNNPGGFLPAYPLLRPSDPLTNVPEANALYAMFKASLTANGAIVPSYWDSLTVPVQGSSQLWPIMPMCEHPAMYTSDLIKMWLEFNKPGPFTVLTALHEWITNGKANDTPTQALSFTKPPQSNQHPVLFVCSKIGDDGGRPPGAVDHFWATSRIFLVNPSGPKIGATAQPSKLSPGDEYNLVAQIGNSGTPAGRCAQQFMNATVTVRADAYAFNTFMTTGGVPLPPLSNLDPSSTNTTYEQYVIGAGSYSLAGFRFNVDHVFDKLVEGLQAAVNADPPLDLGGLGVKEWLVEGHPCVKVRIAGDVNNPLPDDTESPTVNRRIAQRNLVVFDHAFLSQPPQPPSPAPWHNFIVEQPLTLFDHAEGHSTIRLSLQSTLPPEAFKLFLAIPTRTFRRYFSGNKGLNGFQVVKKKELARDISRGRVQPFPDAVILRPTSLSSSLEFDVDARHRHLGMSLGIVYDAAKHPTRPTGKVSMVHEALRMRDVGASAVGGFTIEIVSNERR